MNMWRDESRKLVFNKNKSFVKAFVKSGVAVQISEFNHDVFGKISHLWINRHDGKPMGWTQLQRIKNEIMTEEKLAIQIFPKHRNLIDQANMYHLWVFDTYEFNINENDFKF